MSEEAPRRSRKGKQSKQKDEQSKGPQSQQDQQKGNQDQAQDQSQAQDQQEQSQQTQSQSQDQSDNNLLQTDRGDTTIHESAVSQVSGIAAQEVEGVRMGGGGSQRAAGLLSSITGNSGSSGEGRTQGVSVEVGQKEAAVDLTLTVEYGYSVPQITNTVRRNVINRIDSLLGLRVTEVNVSVPSLFFPDEGEGQEQSQQIESGEGSGQGSDQSSSRVS